MKQYRQNHAHFCLGTNQTTDRGGNVSYSSQPTPNRRPPKKEKTRHLQQYIEPVSAAKIQLLLKKLRISAIIVVYLFLKGY